MNLTINKKNSTFLVEGILNRQTLAKFQQEFQGVFEKYPTIMVNIEGLTQIDKFGVMALTRLHNEALLKGKNFSIIGYGCKEIYQDIENDFVAA